MIPHEGGGGFNRLRAFRRARVMVGCGVAWSRGGDFGAGRMGGFGIEGKKRQRACGEGSVTPWAVVIGEEIIRDVFYLGMLA